MTFEEYQKEALSTALYPNLGDNIFYPTLGLLGEAGEIANKVKKVMRGDYVVEEVADDLAKEIGDQLWYLSALAYEIGVPLEDIATANLKKLKSRQERGVIKGSGDTR